MRKTGKSNLSIEVFTIDDFIQKYPMPRESLSPLQEKQYIEDYFLVCEKHGFSGIYCCSNERYFDYHGLNFTVVRRCTEKEIDIKYLPAWKIEFGNSEIGTDTIIAFPDEIIDWTSDYYRRHVCFNQNINH